ncbi:MAG: hypothetical protein ABJC04_08810 [Verrucomicrobiota bacterium]
MNAEYRVRRATTDDVAELNLLWRAAHLPANELEKRFTEFQVAVDAEGRLAGAIGLQIAGAEGKLHSETYADFGLADTLRPLLWERLRNVAANHGVFRLWTDETAPFWKKNCGFVATGAETMSRFPVQFGSGKTPWLVLQLREDRAAPDVLEAEFARFKIEGVDHTEKMRQQARMFKGIAIGLSVLLFVFVAFSVFYLFRYKDRLPPVTQQTP